MGLKVSLLRNGGATRDRTADLLNAIESLSFKSIRFKAHKLSQSHALSIKHMSTHKYFIFWSPYGHNLFKFTSFYDL